MVDKDEGNLKSKVFFVWGSTCVLCILFAYFFVPETKGLSLEQVDRMLEETTARTSAKWVPRSTFVDDADRDISEKRANKAVHAALNGSEHVENKV